MSRREELTVIDAAKRAHTHPVRIYAWIHANVIGWTKTERGKYRVFADTLPIPKAKNVHEEPMHEEVDTRYDHAEGSESVPTRRGSR